MNLVVFGKALLVMMAASVAVYLAFYVGKNKVHIGVRRRMVLLAVCIAGLAQSLVAAMNILADGDIDGMQALLLLLTWAVLLKTLLSGPVYQKIKRSLARALARLRE